MNSNQQWLLPSQPSTPYRNNYHINPAQSKIVYKSLQSHQKKVVSPQPPQYNNPIQQNLQHNYQNVHQLRPVSSSPIGEQQRINSHYVNHNNVQNPMPIRNDQRVISPPPSNMIYTFQQPLNNQQVNTVQNNSFVQGQKITNTNIIPGAPIIKSKQYINPQSLQPVNQIYSQNNFYHPNQPQIQHHNASSSNSTVTFSYQKNSINRSQLSSIAQQQPPQMHSQYRQSQPYQSSQHQHLVQSTVPTILSSGINIVLSSNVKTDNLSSIHLKQTQSQPPPVIPRIQQTAVQKTLIQTNQNAIDPQFHMTHSIQYHPTAAIGHHRNVQITPNSANEHVQSHPRTPIAQLQQINQMPSNQQIIGHPLQSSQTNQITHQNLHQQFNQNQPVLVNNHIQPMNNLQQQQQYENIIQNTDQASNPPQSSTHPIWQQRFIMIYQKFEWFYQRYDFISREFTILSQQFQNVNSEDQWLELKEKHDLLLEKIQEIQEELINTIHENQQLAEQYQLQNRNSKQSDQGERVWQHRYHQLLQQYKSLSQNYADLQSQGNLNNPMNTSQSQHSQQQPNKLTYQQQIQLQSKFQQLQQQYNILCQQYQKIRIQYEKTYEQSIQFTKQNAQLMENYQQSKNMSNQLQSYVEELQHQNDQLRKQERKSLPQQNGENMIPKQEVEKMEYHFNEELQRYQEELQKYQLRFQQYEEQEENYRQELEKISEIAMQRDNKIKELQVVAYNNTGNNVNAGTASRSNHSTNNGMNNLMGSIEDGPEWQKTYINRLEHEIKQFKEKEKDLLHKLQIKDLERRSQDDKIRYLEKEYEIKKDQLEKLGRNLDEKLIKIQQNTNQYYYKTQGSKHIIQQQVHRPIISNSQYQSQIHQLQKQIHDLQSNLNTKLTHYQSLQNQIQSYQVKIRQSNNSQSISEIQYSKRISEIEIEFNKRIAEKQMKITVMGSEIQRLQDVNQKLKGDINTSREVLQKQFETNKQFIIEKYQSKILQTTQKITQKSNEFTATKQRLLRTQNDLKRKNQQLSELRNFVNQMKLSSSSSPINKSELNQIKEQLKIKQQTLERKIEEINKLKRQKEYKQKHVLELEGEVEELTNEATKRRSEVSTLKRQLNDMESLQSEYDILKSNYNKKISQINQYRQQLFQFDKIRMLLQTSQKQCTKFININKQKSDEIFKLKDYISELEKKMSLLGNNTNKYQINTGAGNKQYDISSSGVRRGGFENQQEIAQLREIIKRKDNQISRTTQSLQQIQYSLQSKTRQLQTQKSQHSAFIRTKQSQLSTLNHKILSLQSRLKQSQSKRINLTQQTQELRQKFQQQIKQQSLRHKSYYEKIISRHEEDYKQIKDRLRKEEEVVNQQELELERNKTMLKGQDIEIKQLNKKLSNQQTMQMEKEEFLSTFRQKQSQSEQSMKGLYEKIGSLELQIKTKDQQLKLSEQKNSILEQKMKKNKKDYQNFRNKLIVSQQYENNNSVVEYLSKRIAQYESKMLNQSQHDFGFKIKDIESNHVFQNQIVYQLKMQNQLLRKQLQGKGIQHDRKILNQLQQQNLKRSKNLLKNSAFSSKLNNISSQFAMKDNLEDVTFYKQKNKQLQKLIQNHLRVNKQLKQKIENLIKGSSNNKQADYYKDQISQYEHKINQLEKQIEVLTEENRTISKGLSKRQSRVEGNYQQRVKQLEVKLNQNNKTIQQLTQQKTELQISRSELEMQKKMLSDQIKRLNEKILSFSQTKNTRYEEQTKQLRDKCETYQSEIAKLMNKSKFLESQIQRLNEMNSSSKQSLNDLNMLRQKVNELNEQAIRAENSLHQEQLRSNSLTGELVSWQQKSKFFENQIERLKQMNELYAKKQKTQLSQSSVLKQSTSSIQIQISTLQQQISSFQQQIHFLQQQKTQQLNIIQSLTQQIQYYKRNLQSFEYNLQLLRSDVLQEQALIEEVVLGSENVQNCIEGLKVNVQRNLYCVNQMFKKIKLL